MTLDTAETVLAHGVGGSTDLPVPLSYALIGAVWALAATFAVVAVAWRTPRFDPAKPGRELPKWVSAVVDSPAIRWFVAVAAGFTVWAAVAAIWGPQGSDNALPGVFYVLLWVGLVAISVVVGPIWRVISPVRTVWRLMQIDAATDPLRRVRPTVPAGPGILAGSSRAVRIRMAGTSESRSWLAGGDQDLDSRLRRRHVPWRSTFWHNMVRPSRPFRGVQRDSLAAGTVQEKSRNRTHRPRESA